MLRALSTWGGVLLSAAVAALVVQLACQLGPRVAFPWDKFVWAESPFLTDMLKLDAGLPVYGPPEDTNSFVYAPGMLWTTYALLGPFGLHLDIRYCRAVACLVAVAAACVSAGVACRLAGTAARRRPHLFLTGWGIGILLVFRSYNGEIPHPDNLHILHSLTVLALCLKALEQPTPRLAAAACAVAGLGILTKQSGVLAAVYAPWALYVGGGRGKWGWTGLAGAAGAGVATAAGGAWFLLRDADARFWTLELLSHHPLRPEWLWQTWDNWMPVRRIVLTALAGIAAAVLWRSPSGAPVRVWAACFAFVLPANLAAYCKEGGWTNNLTIADVWLSIPLIAAAAYGTAPAAGAWAAVGASLFRGSAVLGLLAVVLLYRPVKWEPHPSQYLHCLRLEKAVADDLAAGRRILVMHGTAILIRNGVRESPLDRTNSYFEMLYARGRVVDRSATAERIRRGVYDRIYLDGPDHWVGEELRRTIDSHYRVVREYLPPQGQGGGEGYDHGYQDLMVWTVVLERAGAPREPAPER